ncbi:MAG: hypothetical protein GX096_12860 [Clostridiales bacterium]|nr:hypothetical protein [Clostridiales bacterium]
MIIGSTGLKQICFVTKDLKLAQERWTRILGIEPIHLKTPPWTQLPSYTDGHPDTFLEEDFIVYRLSNGVDIEIFGQGKNPDNPWRKHLDKYGEGVMNIGLYVDEERSEAYKQIGTVAEAKEPYHIGYFSAGTYTFVDTHPELGVELNIKRNEDNSALIEQLQKDPSTHHE